jgi:hypothetical protein
MFSGPWCAWMNLYPLNAEVLVPGTSSESLVPYNSELY